MDTTDLEVQRMNELYNNKRMSKEYKVVFQNSDGDRLTIESTLNELMQGAETLLENYEEKNFQCQSSTCNSESQNFCDCPSQYEDYCPIRVERISQQPTEEADRKRLRALLEGLECREINTILATFSIDDCKELGQAYCGRARELKGEGNLQKLIHQLLKQ